MSLCADNVLGANPLNLTWNVVRGDTAVLKVEFYQSDESTAYDTTGWSYVSTAYETTAGVEYELTVTEGEGYVIITAEDDVTANWGTGSKFRVAQLEFDLEVTTSTQEVWTPVRGIISVISDITGGAL